MLLYISVLLTGCLCHSITVPPKEIALQGSMVTLPCPQKQGDVSWRRVRQGVKVTLVSIKNGNEKVFDKRYGSLADNSLVIRNVTPSDETMYFCNDKTIYLEVTTDPHKSNLNAGNVTPRNNRLDLSFGLTEEDAAGEAKSQHPSDFWKVAAGIVIGAALVLLVVFALRYLSKKRGGVNQFTHTVDKTSTEVIYEEIGTGEEQLRRETDVESPYYWTPASNASCSTTAPNDNQYSTVNKLKAKVCNTEECVYYLAQSPAQTGKE
ncbi:uncharacterized protein V6R79_010166 [Siganus canaliculatus]